MRYFIQFAAALPVCLSMSLAAAQDKVVVIPLNSAKKLNNVVTVSAKDGDFSDPVAAVNSIADATSAKPYLVLIGPGVYTLTQTLVMKPYVTIAGSGRDATTLTGALSSNDPRTAAIVWTADESTLQNLTIENIGGGLALYNSPPWPWGIGGPPPHSPVIKDVTATASGGTSNIAVVNYYSSPIMTDVTATASGEGSTNCGVSSESSSLIMTNVTAAASGYGSTNYAVRNSNDAWPVIIVRMTNVTATASGGASNNFGVYNYYSSPIMTEVTATASGGASNFGVNNYYSSPIMTQVTATASGGLSGYGVSNTSSSPTIRHCTLDGTTNGVDIDGGTTRVMQSSIIGGVGVSSGTLSCVHSDDGVATALGSSCQ